MYGNHLYNQQRFQPMDTIPQQVSNQFIQPIQQLNNQLSLLGKSVDSIDVVRAMDIPLDGSTSYFPLTDGSAIVTKKLMSDGTSRTVVYKPVEENKDEGSRYLVLDDLEDIMDQLNDMKDIKDELKSLKKQIKDIKEQFKED